jgi:hypothetical protein
MESERSNVDVHSFIAGQIDVLSGLNDPTSGTIYGTVSGDPTEDIVYRFNRPGAGGSGHPWAATG